MKSSFLLGLALGIGLLPFHGAGQSSTTPAATSAAAASLTNGPAPAIPLLRTNLGPPAPSNVGNAEYPRVSADRRVTFRIKAPRAKRVQLMGGTGLVPEPLDMLPDTDGAWAISTPPATPGFHYYWFMVDGVHVDDPGSYSYFGYGRETSGLEVPDPDGAYYQPSDDIPRGEVRTHDYFSKITGRWRRAFVYTPASYDRDATARFPVLYLLHGAGENETGWIEQGRAATIIDHLVAGGQARPMILVVDSGYAVPADAVRRFDSQGNPFLDLSQRPPPPTSAFENVLVQELVPRIDSRFRTQADPAHRAIAGLSMGSSQALQLGFKHPELFAWIAAMSPPPRGTFDAKTAYDGAFAEPARFPEKCRLLWLGAGTGEPTFLKFARSMHDELDAIGIRSVLFASPDTHHEWQTWRRCLRDLAPRLF